MHALFLDRDGVVNEECHYLFEPEKVVLTEGVGAAIRAANEAGFLVVVVTNQSGVARGLYTLDDVDAVHRRIVELLGEGEDAPRIDRFYCCPHHATAGMGEFLLDCDCRKPKPGMLLRAAAELGIDLSGSYLVGDMRTDLEAGAAAGCRTYLVRTGHGKTVEIAPEEYVALRLQGVFATPREAIYAMLESAARP